MRSALLLAGLIISFSTAVYAQAPSEDEPLHNESRQKDGPVNTVDRSFMHGCGTGCAVRGTLIEVPELRSGEITSAQFQQEILTNGQIEDIYTRFFWASCWNYMIAFNSEDQFPDQGWIELDQSDYSVNYTTASGGLGHYFDAMCPGHRLLEN